MAKFKFGDKINIPAVIVGITTPVGAEPEKGKGPGNVLQYELELDAGATPITVDQVKVIDRDDKTVVVIIAATEADNFLKSR